MLRIGSGVDDVVERLVGCRGVCAERDDCLAREIIVLTFKERMDNHRRVKPPYGTANKDDVVVVERGERIFQCRTCILLFSLLEIW